MKQSKGWSKQKLLEYFRHNIQGYEERAKAPGMSTCTRDMIKFKKKELEWVCKEIEDKLED